MARNRRRNTIPLFAIPLLFSLALPATAFGESAADLPASDRDVQQQATDSELVSAKSIAGHDHAGTTPNSDAAIFLTASQLSEVQLRANNGEGEAQYTLGAAYQGGGPLLGQDHAAALKWFLKS